MLVDIEIIKNDLLKNISEKYSIPYDKLLTELNHLSKTKIIRSKYFCNHNFFSFDNELSFYWAGFIAADGCAYKKGKTKQLVLSLGEKDLDHLKLFKKHIVFNGNIIKSTTYHSKTNPKWNDSIKYTIRINSSDIYNDLERFNIVPRKTKIYMFPEKLQNSLFINHFMRGYFDGDGSFGYDKKRNRVSFELRGNYDFLYTFKNLLEKNINYKTNVNITTPDSTSKLRYTGKKMMPFLVDFLYKNSTIYLKRKHEIAKKCYEN